MQVLKLADINTVEHGESVRRFRVYFASSLPNESAMFVVRVTLPAASKILSALANA